MKHAFSFPEYIRKTLKDYVNNAILKTLPEQNNQESHYTSTLLSNLRGTVINDDNYKIEFFGANIDDRGKNSAESKYGADLSIVAEIVDKENPAKRIKKAILIQAKLMKESNSKLESKGLKEQIEKMRKITPNPKVMKIAPYKYDRSKRTVSVCSGNKILNDEKYKEYDLADYFVKRVITTFDGDTRPEFVERALRSDLEILQLSVVKK
ncbi:MULTISPECIES: hypothetical protein [unclassified Paenibacillus]|uniref:hypothetical protein n=1 Tax=unclassified Paenibacillus TaxID=185978 RepID=UPI0030F4C5B5